MPTKKLSHILVVVGMVVILLNSCKPSQVSTSQKPPSADTTDIPTYYITSDGDTLESLEETVDINIHRLLKDTISVIGVGDIMMGTNFPSEKYLPPENGSRLWREVNDLLNDADLTFGNLEGVVLDSGGTQKKCNNPDLCYLFRTPERFISNLVDAGFDVMSMANNHAGDFGPEGRENTVKVLDSLGINHAGLIERPYCLITIDGIKFGFAAFSPNTGTLSINDHEEAKKIVTHLDSMSDIVIVSFHGGAEGSKYQHVLRETEFFYGENRGNIYEFAHDLINSGADIIFGHGPHVTRAIEVYQNKFIAYSLGNFCTYARFNLKGANGLAPIIKVYTDHRGKFLWGQIIPIFQEGEGGPKIDPQKRVIKTLQELTSTDFPEVEISINDDGLITYSE
ncbi:MAG: CapA family protein [Bacteroidetes bacterium]|nr:CapA family protein [Bacteroidota bacterium]